MNVTTLIELIQHELPEIKAREISVLDVRALTSIADYLVICTGTSNRHTRAIANHVMDEVKAKGGEHLGVEGMDTGEWVLVDFGDVILHVMMRETRDYYQLEKLWNPDWGQPSKTSDAKAAE